ncbi:MAG: NAD(P)/FAD-dependent oxidoreductase [Rhizobiaceae bacterium]
MAYDIDVLVIGAGVVGLAVARAIAMAGREVLVVEKANAIGAATSSRNSEVIHAGIYYEPGSLKAKLCVEGRKLLYQFCAESGVEARAVGKLIVAQTTDQITQLEALQAKALKNGVTDLQWLTAADASHLEPALRCVAALHSPSTGIVDSHNLMLALQASSEEHGATIALQTEIVSGASGDHGITVELRGAGGATARVLARSVVNCAGHGAHAVAAAIDRYDSKLSPPRYLAKGSYCNVPGKSPFSHLVYPIPVPGALGIHVTLDMQGRARLGPDIEWVDEENYAVSDSIVPQFVRACEGFWPDVRNRELYASYTGIRPKISGPDQTAADFMIQGPEDHGVNGLINLFGIESPGLTSSIAIADHVLRLMRQAQAQDLLRN